MRKINRCLTRSVVIVGFLNFLSISGMCQSNARLTSPPPIQQSVDSLIDTFESILYTDPPQAEVVIKTALELSKTSEYKVGYAKSVLGLGRINTIKGNFEKALDNYARSIDLAESINDKKLLYLSYKSLGSLFLNSGLYEDALANYMTAMSIAENEDFHDEKIRIYNNVALVYGEQGLMESAKQYLLKALALNPPPSLQRGLLNNLGIQYVNLEEYDSALWYYKQSIQVCAELDYKYCEVDAIGNMGQIFFFQKDYDKALDYLFRAKKTHDEKGSMHEQIPVLSNIGRVYQEMGKYKKAIRYLKEGLAKAKEVNSSFLYKMHFNLAWAYQKAGLTDLSWKHIDKHQKIKDSLVSAKSSMRIEKLLTKFEVDRKEKEIELLNKEKELQAAVLATKQSEVDRESQIRNITLISSFVILIPVLILLVVYQQKIRAKELLSIRNEEINKQKTLKLIQDHEIKTIRAKIEGQEKERTRIASDLHDGIGGTLASIKLNLVRIQKENGGTLTLQTVIKNIDDACKEVRTISHHLTPSKILNSSFIEMISSYLKEIKEANAMEIDFSCHPKNDLNLLPDEIKIEVYRIIQELINNIIKHAQTDHVDVQLTQRSESINLMVEDSGIGFDTTKHQSGIGLTNIISRVELLKGEFDIDSSIGRGTIVNVDIPIQNKSSLPRYKWKNCLKSISSSLMTIIYF